MRINNTLTTREKEVGTCLIDGMTAKQVSRTLGISVHTVEGHQRVIKRKLKGKTPYQVGCVLGKMLGEDLNSDPLYISAPLHT
jgi:DNA-binding NarL/FixJ family response regulator